MASREPLWELLSPGPSLETEDDALDEDFVAEEEVEELGGDADASSTGSGSEGDDDEESSSGSSSEEDEAGEGGAAAGRGRRRQRQAPALAPEVAQEILLAVAEIQRRYPEEQEGPAFEEAILSDSELSREFPEEDDRDVFSAGEDSEEEGGTSARAPAEPAPAGGAAGEPGQQQRAPALGTGRGEDGTRAKRAAATPAGGGARRTSKRQRGARQAADSAAMPPPPPRPPAGPSASGAPSAASRLQHAAPARAASAGHAPLSPPPAVTASAGAAGSTAGAGASCAGTSPAPTGSLQAFGALLAPLDAPGTGTTTAATAPIALRTRARHDLADITLEELEGLLQVDEEVEGLGGPDDEAEYQRFLDSLRALPAAGGGGEGRDLAPLFDADREDSDDEDFMVELERLMEGWEEEDEEMTEGRPAARTRVPRQRKLQPQQGGPASRTRRRLAQRSLESVLALRERRLRPPAQRALPPALPAAAAALLPGLAAAAGGWAGGALPVQVAAAAAAAARQQQQAAAQAAPGPGPEGRAPVRWQPPLPAAVRKYLEKDAAAASAAGVAPAAVRPPPFGAPEAGAALEPGAFQPHQYEELHHLIHHHAQLLQQVYVMATDSGDPAHAPTARASHALLLQLQGFVVRQAEGRRAAGVPPYNPVALGSMLPATGERQPRAERLRRLPVHARGSGGERAERGGGAPQDRESEWAPPAIDQVYSIADVSPLRKLDQLLEDLPPLAPASAATSPATDDGAAAQQQQQQQGGEVQAPAQESEEAPADGATAQPRKKKRNRSKKKQPHPLWNTLSVEAASAASRLLRLFDPGLIPAMPSCYTSVQLLFSPTEDELLALGIRRYGYDWARIRAEVCPARSTKQLFHRKKNRTNGTAADSSIRRAVAMVAGPLEPDEVAVLEAAMRYYGRQPHRWELICSAHLPHRNPQASKGVGVGAGVAEGGMPEQSTAGRMPHAQGAHVHRALTPGFGRRLFSYEPVSRILQALWQLWSAHLHKKGLDLPEQLPEVPGTDGGGSSQQQQSQEAPPAIRAAFLSDGAAQQAREQAQQQGEEREAAEEQRRQAAAAAVQAQHLAQLAQLYGQPIVPDAVTAAALAAAMAAGMPAMLPPLPPFTLPFGQLPPARQAQDQQAAQQRDGAGGAQGGRSKRARSGAASPEAAARRRQQQQQQAPAHAAGGSPQPSMTTRRKARLQQQGQEAHQHRQAQQEREQNQQGAQEQAGSSPSRLTRRQAALRQPPAAAGTPGSVGPAPRGEGDGGGPHVAFDFEALPDSDEEDAEGEGGGAPLVAAALPVAQMLLMSALPGHAGAAGAAEGAANGGDAAQPLAGGLGVLDPVAAVEAAAGAMADVLAATRQQGASRRKPRRPAPSAAPSDAGLAPASGLAHQSPQVRAGGRAPGAGTAAGAAAAAAGAPGRGVPAAGPPEFEVEELPDSETESDGSRAPRRHGGRAAAGASLGQRSEPRQEQPPPQQQRGWQPDEDRLLLKTILAAGAALSQEQLAELAGERGGAGMPAEGRFALQHCPS
eukprot:scaffold1.g5507.t1